MRKILVLLLSMCMGVAFARNDVSAIYAWVDGSATCYRLESMPKVTYEADFAVLSFADGTPEVAVPLENGGRLLVTFGVYDTQLQQPDKPVEQVGKIIRGGQLYIIRSGVVYDMNGRVVTTMPLSRQAE